MRILHLSTSTSGGAGLAAFRSVKALNTLGVSTDLLSRERLIVDGTEQVCAGSTLTKMKSATVTLLQRQIVQNSEELITTLGIDLFKKKSIPFTLLNEYDVVHLHACYNFFKYDKLLSYFPDKPLVITLHDERLITGGCHYTIGCTEYLSDCSGCPKVHKIAKNWVTREKSKINLAIGRHNLDKLHLVTPSEWLGERVSSVRSFSRVSLSIVRNCVPDFYFRDLKYYRKSSNRKRIGIAASDLQGPYKGFEFFTRSMKEMSNGSNQEIEIVLISNAPHRPTLDWKGAIQFINPKSEMAYLDALDSLDVLCVPSLIDNSPNVTIEALSRGVVVVSSDAGGAGEFPSKVGLKTFIHNDIESFCVAMRDGISVGRLSSAQIVRIQELISGNRHAKSLREIYRSLI
jgi:glycosyltransferase involved in cell wall biosynthesis